MNEQLNQNEPLREANVSSSADHDKWLEKFNRSKEGKLFNLKHELESLNNPYSLTTGRADINSYCASAIWIVVKGTRYEEDMRYFIKTLCPDFFQE
ncbi:MAG: hypothetical protein ACK518_04490 [bacterium]|jgi:hypothetical protein